MNINTQLVDAILAIDIEGRLDTQTYAAALDELLAHIDAKPDKVLIRLSSLEFVSSAGLRVILRIAKQVSGYGGELKVSSAQGVVQEVLAISGFDKLLDLHKDEAEAIASFQ